MKILKKGNSNVIGSPSEFIESIKTCGEARRTYNIRRIMRAVKNVYNKSKTENI